MSGPDQTEGGIEPPASGAPADEIQGISEPVGEQRKTRRERYKQIARRVFEFGPILVIRRRAHGAYKWSVDIFFDGAKGMVIVTWILVVVGVAALLDSQASTEAAQRAWVGPLGLSSAAPTEGADLDITLMYLNSGRQPATDFIPALWPFAQTIEVFNDGRAYNTLEILGGKCMGVKQTVKGQTAFPSSNNSGYTYGIQIPKRMIDADVIKGDKVLFVEGCFLYRTFEKVRHSAFCFYYRAGKTKPQTWNICTGGHDAD